MPEAVDKVGVVRASVADEQADGRREEEPAEGVTRQAAGDEETDRRTRDADDHRHDPVADLAGHHGQRDIRRQEQRQPGHRLPRPRSPDLAVRPPVTATWSPVTPRAGRAVQPDPPPRSQQGACRPPGQAMPSAFRERYRSAARRTPRFRLAVPGLG